MYKESFKAFKNTFRANSSITLLSDSHSRKEYPNSNATPITHIQPLTHYPLSDA